MKKITLTTSDYVAIVLFIIGVLIAYYQQEIKDMIANLTTQWQYLLFWGSVIGLLWRFTHIFLRNRVDKKVNERLENISSEIKYEFYLHLIDLKKYTDTHIEEFEEIIKFKDVADKKQTEFIFQALDSKTSPTNLVDDEAVRVHTKNQNERKEIMEQITAKFKKFTK